MTLKWLTVAFLGTLAPLASAAMAQTAPAPIHGDFAAINAQEAALAAKQLAKCKKTGLIWIGMSKAMLIACLGKPLRTFTTINAGGRHEQLVYRSGYVYIERGVISALQKLH